MPEIDLETFLQSLEMDEFLAFGEATGIWKEPRKTEYRLIEDPEVYGAIRVDEGPVELEELSSWREKKMREILDYETTRPETFAEP